MYGLLIQGVTAPPPNPSPYTLGVNTTAIDLHLNNNIDASNANSPTVSMDTLNTYFSVPGATITEPGFSATTYQIGTKSVSVSSGNTMSLDIFLDNPGTSTMIQALWFTNNLTPMQLQSPNGTKVDGTLSLVGTTVSFSFVVPAYNPPNWPGTGSLSVVTNGSTTGVEIKFTDV